ncbi:unnamed protein product [Camellia sinensis]
MTWRTATTSMKKNPTNPFEMKQICAEPDLRKERLRLATPVNWKLDNDRALCQLCSAVVNTPIHTIMMWTMLILMFILDMSIHIFLNMHLKDLSTGLSILENNKKLKDDNDDDDKIQQQSLNEKNESVLEMSTQGKVLDEGSEKQNQSESLRK